MCPRRVESALASNQEADVKLHSLWSQPLERMEANLARLTRPWRAAAWLRATAAVAVLLLFGACSPAPDQVQFDDVAQRIFSQLDVANYQAIYDEASGTFQEGPGGAASFARAMDENQHKLGRCQEPTGRESLRTILTRYGFVSVREYVQVCANGAANVEVSAVKREGQAKLLGLHFTSAALGISDPLASRPEWVSKEDLTLLKSIEIDPQADLETRAAYHWRWRASHIFKAGNFVCPPGSTVDVARSIKIIIAAEGEFCWDVSGRNLSQLKLYADGSTTPLGDGR